METRGRPKAELMLSSAERSQLSSYVRSRSLPAALSARARIILNSAEGESNSSIAARLKLSKVDGGQVAWTLYRVPHRGALRRLTARGAAQHRRRARGQSDQDDPAHQARRRFDALERARCGRGDRHLQEQRAALLPALWPAAASHRGLQELSNNPLFVEKLRDVVGLYLSPPENALVLCVDE